MNRSHILAIHPDPRQASMLRAALCERIDTEVLVVNAQDIALNAIDRRIPDLILVHAFMPPGDEADLVAYLRTLPNTEHVQVISIPLLQFPSERAQPKRFLRGGLKPPRLVPTIGCDPRLFAAEVAEYLSQARALKTEVQQKAGDGFADTSDRRRAFRWSPLDVPWVSLVHVATDERADLIDVSAGGALVRTCIRPRLTPEKYLGRPSEPRTSLTFRLATGQEVRTAAQVIRCHVESLENGAVLYRVAFRFDESLALELPSNEPMALQKRVCDRDAAAANALPVARTEGREEVFSDSVTSQNALPDLLATVPLSAGARQAIAKLTSIDAALLQIRTTLSNARRTSTAESELTNLATRLGPRIRQLRLMRGRVIETISEDDLALIAARTRRDDRTLAAS